MPLALCSPGWGMGGTLDFYPYTGSARGNKKNLQKYQNLKMHPKIYHTSKTYPKNTWLKI